MRNHFPFFISVEGSEGAGKTSNVNFIKKSLEASGCKVCVTREPGGTEIGELLREILLEKHPNRMTDQTELLIMFAARAQHVEQVIKPALARGECVLCDRFTDATYAYQGGGRGIDYDRIRALEKWTLGDFEPHLTLLLDIPVDKGMQRIRERGELDRFEVEDFSFFERVRSAYLALADKQSDRIHIIDAAQTLEHVQLQIKAVLDRQLDLSTATHPEPSL